MRRNQNPDFASKSRMKDILDRMSLEEKLSLLSGKDFWHTRDIERLGIPSIRMTDGPHGVTVSHDLSGPGTCFPTGIAMAASWDPGLVERIGAALARETRARNSQMLLGPCIDIHRSPLNGRNYESFSEDPYLTAKIAVAYIRGVQRQGIGTAVKHYTCNNQQTDQQQVSVEVDERTLREIYLPAFKAAVRQADCWAVMNAYNRVNGLHCSENPHLLSEILKREWNFRGFTLSDWRSVHSSRAASAGLDLEMPGPGKYLTAEHLSEELEEGNISEKQIDEKIRRLLGFIMKAESADQDPGQPKDQLDTPEHRNLALETAEQSIVLLKNDKDILPLREDGIRSIAVIGPNAEKARLGGGGSSSVTPFYAVSPLDGLIARCGKDIQVFYQEGCSLKGNLPVVVSEYLSHRDSGRKVAGLKGEYFNTAEYSGIPVFTRIDRQIDFAWGWRSPGESAAKNDFSVRWSGQIEAPMDGTYLIGVAVEDGWCRLFLNGSLRIDLWGETGESFENRYASRSETAEVDLKKGRSCDIRMEYAKRGNKASVRLEWVIPNSGDPIEKAASLAAGADVSIVFAGLSNQFEGGNNDREDLELPGRQADLIDAVCGANRNTVVVLINGSPVKMDPWVNKATAILEAWYPGQEGGTAIARILFGDVNPSGKLPDTFPRRLEDSPSYGNYPGNGDTVHYEEGIFVGYRHYEKKGIQPLFPFGYGLSYTRFEYRHLAVHPARITAGEGFTVSVDVTNAGKSMGKEVVQLYVGDSVSTLERPIKELKAFRKIELEAGETGNVSFMLDSSALSYYDPEKNHWIAEPGEFSITVGGSSCGGITGHLLLA